MNVCIYGAGAIGGYLGVELALSGVDVTLIARGPHLAAMQAHGLTLLINGERKVARVRATDNPAEAGRHDYVVLGLKAHSVPPIVAGIAPLLDAETAVVTAQNGVPWWYFHTFPGPHADHRIHSVDPGGVVWDTLGPERAIGCVVYPSCEIVEPGVVRHIDGNRFMVGEPDGTRSERVTRLSKALMAAGLKAPVRPRIRDDIWLKLWGNCSFNPVSVLTHATLVEMTSHAPTREVIRLLMTEAAAVAGALGVKFPVDVETRIQWGADVGAHKTSMLQDLERGRPMEIDALVTAVSELGRLVGVPTPTLDAVLALVLLRASLAGGA